MVYMVYMVYVCIYIYISQHHINLFFETSFLKFHIKLRQLYALFRRDDQKIIAHCGEVKLDPQALPWDGTLVRSPGAAGFRES